eukprot:scaffold317579_cov35-Tisochrysis_lutea.AAC.1
MVLTAEMRNVPAHMHHHGRQEEGLRGASSFHLASPRAHRLATFECGCCMLWSLSCSGWDTVSVAMMTMVGIVDHRASIGIVCPYARRVGLGLGRGDAGRGRPKYAHGCRHT